MHRGLRLTVIFESYKHEFEPFKEPQLLQRLVLNPIPNLLLFPVGSVFGLESFFEPQAKI